MSSVTADTLTSAPETHRAETLIILVLSAVQFVNALDFLMVMPLGPDLSQALHFDVTHLGWLGGAYMVSASLSGLVLSAFLDRFDRRTALLCCVFGLSASTVLGGFMTSFPGLLFARILAGGFGGPATAMTFSMAADVSRPERRGRAMASVMSGFSIASVLGVPAGLELARLGSWRMPFFATGGLAFVLFAIAFRVIPSLRAHIERARLDHPWRATLDLVRRREVLYAYGALSIGMCASFLIIPNLATFVQYNLGFPREHLSGLYLKAGLITLAFVIVSGRLIDRWGSTVMSAIATTLLILFVWGGMIADPPVLGLQLMFVGFMTTLSLRSVAGTALASRVPGAHERARFTSILSVVQNAMSAVGAIASSLILTHTGDGKLVHMPIVAGLSLFVALFVVVFVALLEKRMRGIPHQGP